MLIITNRLVVPKIAMAMILFAIFVLALPLSAQSTRSGIIVPNAGFEEGTPGQAPPQWSGSVATQAPQSAGPPHYRAVIDGQNPREGQSSARLEHVAADRDPRQFGTITNRVDAKPYRGRRVRLTGSVRSEVEPATHVGLWFRVDREQNRMGFFDNMQNRPIRNAAWADYVVEGDVAADAERLVFGMLLVGPGRAWLDNVRLEDVGPARGPGLASDGSRPREESGPGDEPARPLDDRGLGNLRAFSNLYGLIRFFHPSDEAAAADWDSLALAGVARVEAARSPAELAAALNAVFQPVAPSFEAYVTAESPEFARSRPGQASTARRWRHVGMGTDGAGIYSSTREPVEAVTAEDVLTVPLAGGVSARVPIVVWADSSGATLPRSTAPIAASGKPDGFVPAGFDRTTRLAAVASGWSMFRHFYPYFDVVDVDWDAELDRALRAAATDEDDRIFHQTLRRLVAALQDGHGAVIYSAEPKGILPLAWDWVEDRLVVTHVAQGNEDITRGDVVTHVGGIPAEQLTRERMALFSGSPQWTRHQALADALTGPIDSPVELRLLGADGRSRTVTAVYREVTSGQRVREPKPDPITELAPGIVYVDLDRVTEAQFRQREADLVAARGLVFDLRGYPRMPPAFLARLADRPVQSAQFDAPIYLRPGQQGVTYHSGGWNMAPVAPRFTDNVAFITNGSAISFAESVLGLVAANRLADIVGEPSAGANGNVSSFLVPGGYRLLWTAMRVVNRDGSQHHLKGVLPNIPTRRTLAGVRAGRDELLERALETVTRRLEPRPAG